jgi:hypothetical protein
MLGFIKLMDVEVLLTGGHTIVIEDVKDATFEWGRSITLSIIDHVRPVTLFL